MRVHVRKWGKSASVRIPAAILAAADLRVDQEVEIREDQGRVVIEPVRAPRYDLAELLDRMTPDSFPDEVDFGPRVGGDVW